MRVIIAGSRDLGCDIMAVVRAVEASGFEITEVVCGEAPGIDTAGRKWAHAHKIPVASFPAKWDDLNAPGAVIKKRVDGTRYNLKAGYDRNIQMAHNADALIAIQKNASRGTQHMIDTARKLNLKIYVETL